MIPPIFKDRKRTSRIPREVTALLVALQFTEPKIDFLVALTEEEWRKLIAFCDLAHLTLPLASLASESFPDWVVARLKANLSDNALRFQKIKETYREAALALEEAGVEHVVIKGFTQAPDFVSDPHLRGQSDFDIYCPPQSLPTARSVLLAIGYRSEENVDLLRADHDYPLIRLGNWRWRGNPFDPQMPLGIELHHSLWNEAVSGISIPEVDLFWQRRVTRELDGLSFPCFNQVDQLGYMALHVVRNVFLREWVVHHVREIATFLHSHADDDLLWQTWVSTHSPSLRSMEAIAFYLARSWFGCCLPHQVEEVIIGLPEERLKWLQYFSLSPFEVMFRLNKNSLWLQLNLIPTRAKKWKVLRSTLLPTHVGSVTSQVVKVRNKRVVDPSGAHPWLLYFRYLISRSISHSHASITTLIHGFRWQLWRHRLAPQFWMFFAASFFFDLGLSIFYFLFNLFLVSNGYTEKSLGLVTSAMAAGNLAGAIPAGQLTRRFGLRPILVSCFFFAIIISSARALLLSFPAQIVLAFAAGITLSAWAVCLSPTVAQLAQPKQRPLAFSLLFSLGIGLGALGGFFGSRLPDWFVRHHALSRTTLQPAQIVLLLSCAVVAFGIWPAMKVSLKRPHQEERAPTQPLLSPFMLRFLPAIAVWSLVTGSFSPLASVYFARHLHFSLHQIGNAFSLSQIAQVVAVLVAPVLFRRLGLVAGIVSTQAAASVLLFALAALGHPLGAISAYIAFSAFQWMNEPGLYSLLMNSVPEEERGRASAGNSLVSSISQVVAAAVAGAAFARYGYPVVLRAIALFALLAATLFWSLQDSRKRKSSPVLDDISC